MLEASETEQLLAHIYTLYQRVDELNDRITKLTEIFQQYIKLCKTQSKT